VQGVSLGVRRRSTASPPVAREARWATSIYPCRAVHTVGSHRSRCLSPSPTTPYCSQDGPPAIRSIGTRAARAVARWSFHRGPVKLAPDQVAL
jgi:hypothetical protein